MAAAAREGSAPFPAQHGPQAQGQQKPEKARRRVARLHARVADARRDFHHQFSTRLVREHQTVYVETLNLAGMGRSKLAKSVHDRQVIKVDPWYPSSQVCSACGHRAGPKPLKVRSWTCPGCGVAYDRDLNASKNILGAGLALAACGVGVRPGATSAVDAEAGTTLTGAA